jgi:hypothetical protein
MTDREAITRTLEILKAARKRYTGSILLPIPAAIFALRRLLSELPEEPDNE